jgi:hypothetical protein
MQELFNGVEFQFCKVKGSGDLLGCNMSVLYATEWHTSK